ncbi:hypothetical protein Tco_0563604 [Tanacetum coccineum]
MAWSGTDLKMAKIVISSPNHPTFDIEDAFSSHFLDYILASPDCVLASPGKTYSSSLNNSFGVVPIVSPTLSLFHNDHYMKELLSPKKQGHNQSLSFTSALPQEFEMGESSRKTSLERHEEKIEDILNYLDELSLDRIEHIEDKIEGLGKVQRQVVHDIIQWQSRYTLLFHNTDIHPKTTSLISSSSSPSMPPKRMSTSEAPTMTQAAIRKLVADSVTVTLEAQAANMANTDNTTRPREAYVAKQCRYKEFMRCQPINFKGMEGAVGLIHWFKRTESVFSRSNYTEDCKVKFATGTLIEEALS